MTREEKKALADKVRQTTSELSALLAQARNNRLKVLISDNASKGLINNYEKEWAGLTVFSVTEIIQY